MQTEYFRGHHSTQMEFEQRWLGCYYSKLMPIVQMRSSAAIMPLQQKQDQTPSVQLLRISPDNAEQRLDNFLINRLKGVPKSRIYRMVRKGEVRVNRGRKSVQYRLQAGDIVRVPPVRIASQPTTMVPHTILHERVAKRIIYEDAHIMIVNKPAGLAVHGGSGLSFGLIEGLRHLRPNHSFLELVHRLDRDTSGCLLVAKKRSALRKLHELFRSDRVDKRYLVLLSGAWDRKKATVDAPLEKNVRKGGERMVVVSKAGKTARTGFTRMQCFKKATLVEAQPKTGRTHQIRVHAACLGHPVAGDERYGETETNRNWRREGLKRLFLHAAHLRFIHPQSGQPIRIEAPLDEELADFLHYLKHEKPI
jgi:23S rRNA pseudouridine955/2504/2580 synthase